MTGSVRRVVALAILVAGIVVLGGAGGTAEAQSKKVESDADLNAIGRPAQFHKGMPAAYAVSYEDGVWKLSMTSKNGKGKKDQWAVMKGTVKVEGGGVTITANGLERAKKARKSDTLTMHAGAGGFDFKCVVHGDTDYVEFKVGPKAQSITFDLKVGDDDNRERIFVGANSTHPPKAKFTLPAHPGK